MQIISGKDNRWLKTARLVASKKGREQQGCYLAEGLRLCGEAVSLGLPILQALFAESALADPRFARLAEETAEAGYPLAQVSDELFAKACATEHPQGVALLLALPERKPLPKTPGGCYAYADGIRDPGNLGTIIRSAQAVGLSGLLLSPDSADPFNPKVVRSAMGASFKLPLLQCESLEEARQQMRELDCAILVADAGGADVRDCGPYLRRSHIWVLGSEADGPDPFWRAEADSLVSLPMEPDAESLNVASAAAVLFYQSRFARA